MSPKEFPEIDEARAMADLVLSEDLEARAKVVKCKYTGGCNVWYYNKDDFCDYCMQNLEAKEDPDARPVKPKPKSNSGDGRRSHPRRAVSKRRGT